MDNEHVRSLSSLVFLGGVVLGISLLSRAKLPRELTHLTGIVRVESTYFEAPPVSTAVGINPITGTGTIVRIDSHCYVLTSSHVSSGENLKLFEGGVLPLEYEPSIRLSDAKTDLALIRLKADCASLNPMAEWYPHREHFMIDENSIKLPKPFLGREVPKIGPPFEMQVMDVSQNAIMPLPPWVGCVPANWKTEKASIGRDAFRDERGFLKNFSHLTFTMSETFVPTRIPEGSSGSPLIENNVPGLARQKVIKGLAKRNLRKYEGSFFSHEVDIENFVHKLQIRLGLKGIQDQWIGSVRWLSRNGLLFKDYGGGTWEINPNSNWTGNGHSGDPGNGHSGDPGHSGPPEPKSCLAGEKGKTQGIDEDLVRFGLNEGLKWKGQPICLFRIQNREGFSEFYIEANSEALNYLERLREGDFTPLGCGQPLWPLLQKKLSLSSKLSKRSSSERYCSITPKSDGSIEVKIPLGRFESIEFELDSFGILKSQKQSKEKFQSLLALKSSRRNPHLVDIRGLYYQDLGMIPWVESGNLVFLRQVEEPFVFVRGFKDKADTVIYCR